MTQNWIAVDLDERVCLHGGGSLEEWFWSDPGSILDALRIPSTSEKIAQLLAGPFSKQRASPLLRLPPELIDSIFVEINASAGAHDTRLFLFALTCKDLLSIAQRHLVRRHMQYHAPLAGHRIVCIGDGATELADYPAGLLTDAEQQTLLRVQSEDPDGIEGEERACLYDYATKSWWRYQFRRPQLLGCVGLTFADLIHRPSAFSRMSTEDFLRFQELTAPYYAEGPRHRWVLCNLSKHEYVRAEGVQEVEQGSAAFAFVAGKVMLWHLLLMCVCWSPLPAGNMAYKNEELRMGRWAGDRISVTTLERMGESDKEDVWKDVTQEVVQHARELRMSKSVKGKDDQ